MISESEIQQRIQIEGPKHNCILQRNNSGAFKDATGRWVFFGLGNAHRNQEIKSSDLIGITTITITPEMVGKQIGVFTAVEVKEEGWEYNPKDKRERGQLAYINWVKARHGFAGFSNSLDTFKKIIGI